MERITARSNPLLTHIRRLAADRGYRHECGEYLADSPKLLQEALLWDAELVNVVCGDGMELPPLPAGVRAVQVPADVMASVSPMRAPQGVLFTCRIPTLPLPEKLTGRRYAVLEGVQDPGNVGTVLRTLDAFDADGLFLLPGCADIYSPKTLRASMGAVFRLPLYTVTLPQLSALLDGAGLPLYGTALRHDTVDVRSRDLRRCALVIGSEGQGVRREILEQADAQLIIPMNPRCESLNAAVAAAIVMWQMRQ